MGINHAIRTSAIMAAGLVSILMPSQQSLWGADSQKKPHEVVFNVEVSGESLSFTDQYSFEESDQSEAVSGVLRVGGGSFNYVQAEEYTISKPVWETVRILKKVHGMVVEVPKTVKRIVTEYRQRTVLIEVHLPSAHGFWLDESEGGTTQWTFYKKVGTGYVLGQGTIDGASLEGTVFYENIQGIPDGAYDVKSSSD